MKTLNNYMVMFYRMEIVEDKDEGGFMVYYPDLPGCITCGEIVESAVTSALDAKKAWFEVALEDGVEIHELCIFPFQKWCILFKITIAKCLCYGYNEVATNWQQKISKPK